MSVVKRLENMCQRHKKLSTDIGRVKSFIDIIENNRPGFNFEVTLGEHSISVDGDVIIPALISKRDSLIAQHANLEQVMEEMLGACGDEAE